MNRSLTTVVGFALALAVLPTLATAQRAEWTTLFDGSSLDRWNAIGSANWALADRAVGANDGNGFLVSDRSYDDFELRLEFWVDEPANSGIFIRCADPSSVNDRNCYEVNIYDTRADQTYRTGGIVHLAAPNVVISSGGQWNTYHITAQGSRLIVSLNGDEMVDTTDDQFSSGPFALQYAAGTVRFRNVQIRALD
jgi:hypothetical protein